MGNITVLGRGKHADLWYEPIRLGKGTIIIVIESKLNVGDIVTAYYNSLYGIQCETVHR